MKTPALSMKTEDISAYLAEHRDQVISECYEFMVAYDKAWRLLETKK